MFSFDILQSGLVILVLLLAGEILSRRFRGVFPSSLVAGILFLATVWAGILPKDLVESSGLTSLTILCITFMLTTMGASIRLKELAADWRVVALAALTLVCQTAMMLLVIWMIYDWNTAIGTIPGGSPVAFMIQEHARALGHDDIVVLATLVMCVRSLVASPIVSVLLRKESRRLLDSHDESLYGDGELPVIAGGSAGGASGSGPKKGGGSFGFSEMGSVYKALLLLYAISWCANRLQMLTGGPQYVLCFVLGVLLAEAGILPRDILNRTKSSGFLNFIMMTIVMMGFRDATPEMFRDLLIPLIVVMAVNVGSICIFGALFGKLLGFSVPMGMAIGFNIMIGFPLNLIISEDIIGYAITDERDRQMLMTHIATKMIIGGLTSTTCLATLIGSVLVTFMV